MIWSIEHNFEIVVQYSSNVYRDNGVLILLKYIYFSMFSQIIQKLDLKSLHCEDFVIIRVHKCCSHKYEDCELNCLLELLDLKNLTDRLNLNSCNIMSRVLLYPCIPLVTWTMFKTISSYTGNTNWINY